MNFFRGVLGDYKMNFGRVLKVDPWKPSNLSEFGFPNWRCQVFLFFLWPFWVSLSENSSCVDLWMTKTRIIQSIFSHSQNRGGCGAEESSLGISTPEQTTDVWSRLWFVGRRSTCTNHHKNILQVWKCPGFYSKERKFQTILKCLHLLWELKQETRQRIDYTLPFSKEKPRLIYVSVQCNALFILHHKDSGPDLHPHPQRKGNIQFGKISWRVVSLFSSAWPLLNPPHTVNSEKEIEARMWLCVCLVWLSWTDCSYLSIWLVWRVETRRPRLEDDEDMKQVQFVADPQEAWGQGTNSCSESCPNCFNRIPLSFIQLGPKWWQNWTIWGHRKWHSTSHQNVDCNFQDFPKYVLSSCSFLHTSTSWTDTGIFPKKNIRSGPPEVLISESGPPHQILDLYLTSPSAITRWNRDKKFQDHSRKFVSHFYTCSVSSSHANNIIRSAQD